MLAGARQRVARSRTHRLAEEALRLRQVQLELLVERGARRNSRDALLALRRRSSRARARRDIPSAHRPSCSCASSSCASSSFAEIDAGALFLLDLPQRLRNLRRVRTNLARGLERAARAPSSRPWRAPHNLAPSCSRTHRRRIALRCARRRRRLAAPRASSASALRNCSTRADRIALPSPAAPRSRPGSALHRASPARFRPCAATLLPGSIFAGELERRLGIGGASFLQRRGAALSAAPPALRRRASPASSAAARSSAKCSSRSDVLARLVVLVARRQFLVRAPELFAAPLLRGARGQLLQPLVDRRAPIVRVLLGARQRGEVDFLLFGFLRPASPATGDAAGA